MSLSEVNRRRFLGSSAGFLALPVLNKLSTIAAIAGGTAGTTGQIQITSPYAKQLVACIGSASPAFKLPAGSVDQWRIIIFNEMTDRACADLSKSIPTHIQRYPKSYVQITLRDQVEKQVQARLGDSDIILTSDMPEQVAQRTVNTVSRDITTNWTRLESDVKKRIETDVKARQEERRKKALSQKITERDQISRACFFARNQFIHSEVSGNTLERIFDSLPIELPTHIRKWTISQLYENATKMGIIGSSLVREI